jgi:hypothetical protein
MKQQRKEVEKERKKKSGTDTDLLIPAGGYSSEEEEEERKPRSLGRVFALGKGSRKRSTSKTPKRKSKKERSEQVGDGSEDVKDFQDDAANEAESTETTESAQEEEEEQKPKSLGRGSSFGSGSKKRSTSKTPKRKLKKETSKQVDGGSEDVKEFQDDTANEAGSAETDESVQEEEEKQKPKSFSRRFSLGSAPKKRSTSKSPKRKLKKETSKQVDGGSEHVKEFQDDESVQEEEEAQKPKSFSGRFSFGSAHKKRSTSKTPKRKLKKETSKQVDGGSEDLKEFQDDAANEAGAAETDEPVQEEAEEKKYLQNAKAEVEKGNKRARIETPWCPPKFFSGRKGILQKDANFRSLKREEAEKDVK